MRERGYRLCEFTRLAVDKTVASKPVLAGLFHTAYLYAAVIRDYTHAVIEVNPRHVTFYRRALGFEPIGPKRTNLRVNAPAVLLCVPFAAIAEGLERYAGKPLAAGVARSLFPYGFPPSEERGVLGAVARAGAGEVAAGEKKPRDESRGFVCNSGVSRVITLAFSSGGSVPVRAVRRRAVRASPVPEPWCRRRPRRASR